MFFYDRTEFPSAYRDGVFIAFHGSWDRAPFAQGGYNVAFQSLAKSGRCERFADGFAGDVKSPDKAAHRLSADSIGRKRGSLCLRRYDGPEFADGVMQPKQYRSPMPPAGGAQLTADQTFAVAADVWSLSH
jgi:hypothetical protein